MLKPSSSSGQQAFTLFAYDRILIAVSHLSFPGIGHIHAVEAALYECRSSLVIA